MSNMCLEHHCEQTNSDNGYLCTICHTPFRNCERNDNSDSLNGDHPVQYCRSCLDKFKKCTLRSNGLCYVTPSVSPALSLTSISSCASSFGDLSSEENSKPKEYGNEALDTGQHKINVTLLDAIEEQGDGNLFRTSLPLSMEETCTSTLESQNLDASNIEKAGSNYRTLEYSQSFKAGVASDEIENTTGSGIGSYLSMVEMDPLIWIPPEPEDSEVELDSVANNYEDDEYTDGTKWGQPTSLDEFDEVHGNGHSDKEERQKAMMEAMNGQFKILVSRFLASEGLDLSNGDTPESWLDIVASLSWEAALYVKPDASEGRAMDPGSYVKVKCIASGLRSHSQMIKGLVFKKSTAHKHMPTTYQNPRLLLLQGLLGHSVARLSSFKSMEQEKDYLKSIIEMIETCQPNVVLVEKSVSRDIQESLLAKGVTLVSDMKQARLERIARCTGDQITSVAEILMRPKLKQCDCFRIEKVIEEHNLSGETVKRSTKTLMFLEGFPKPLGCTILLKGAHIDELKKIKRVIQYTVFAAYHLILETSFFADQRAYFMGLNSDRGGTFSDREAHSGNNGVVHNADILDEDFTAGTASEQASDIEISDRTLERHFCEGMHANLDSSKRPSFGSDAGIIATQSNLSGIEIFGSDEYHASDLAPSQILPWNFQSSMPSSFYKMLGENFPHFSTDYISSYFSFKERDIGDQHIDVLSASQSPRPLESLDNGMAMDVEIGLVNENTEVENGETDHITSNPPQVDACDVDVNNKAEMQSNVSIESVLDPQSILVLLSSHCIAKRTVCDQSHLSRIQYYGNSDMSLGRYLQDILLSQGHSCASCGELPDGHLYRYTHKNWNLTVRVKKLPPELSLSDQERKIWMWTLCLKCRHENSAPKSTKRVVLSNSARGLSFGKFLELSFSGQSTANRLSICGHSLHRDCLRFFGLGSQVAMFKHSLVEVYNACKPPPLLGFCDPNEQEWLKTEARDVFAKGEKFFVEVEELLQEIKPGLSSSHLKSMSGGLVEEFHDIEEMLVHEKTEFKDYLLKMAKPVNEILDFNWLIQDLILKLYVWDRRLDALLAYKRNHNSFNKPQHFNDELGSVCSFGSTAESTTGADGSISDVYNHVPINVEELSSNVASIPQNDSTKTQREPSESFRDSTEKIQGPSNDALIEMECSINESSASLVTIEAASSPKQDHPSNFCEPLNIVEGKEPGEERFPSSALTGNVGHADFSATVANGTTESIKDPAVSSSKEQNNGDHVIRELFNSKENPETWFWSHFSEIRITYRKDLHGGYLQKFAFIHSYVPKHLSPVNKLMRVDSLHFPVGTGNDVLFVCEDEISSIIACALALSEEHQGLPVNIYERDLGQGKEDPVRLTENIISQRLEGVEALLNSPSFSSMDSDGLSSRTTSSSSSEYDLYTSGILDYSSSVDHLISSDSLHPEILVGVGKAANAKSKYSVVCIHARQFYDLRKRCCPSEVVYISSLRRCKVWDAQGGKSKAFFAKTLDDRLIIKQIKKTELDSFLKFASDYFKHITHALDTGSQTCLAKVLGIYQVRMQRGAKEVRTDLLVMENLMFGRNVSRIYDLKGSVFSRYISDSDGPGKVLLDQNFVEDMCENPIYVPGRTKQLLQRAIWNDTAFLTSINVMDYSLLVGVDKQHHEFVFGIIDYLRQYTWDKQLETWVKASLVVPKNSLPTIISPKEYKKRFRKFMSKNFLSLPDAWSPERLSLCVDGSSQIVQKECLNGSSKSESKF